jgi:hypothetical protein
MAGRRIIVQLKAKNRKTIKILLEREEFQPLASDLLDGLFGASN